MKKGEVTAFLSLIFILLMALIGGLIESASIQTAKNYKRADMNRAMECIFAEYQKELLEDYGIFALEATYECGRYDEKNIKERLMYFGTGGMEHQIQKIQFLTDDGGKAFYEQILYYMEHKYGINLLKDKISMSEIWKKQEKKAEDYEKEETEGWSHFENLMREENRELTEENNPLQNVKKLKQTPVLTLIVPEEMKVSEKNIDQGSLLSDREKNRGYGDFSEEERDTGALSTLIFGEYLQEFFTAAADEISEESRMKKTKKKERLRALDYELEYLCAGKTSDRENLESVAKKLLGLRFGVNYAFLQGSASKQAEAHALAVTLCTLSAMPQLEGAVEQVLLLSWAYGESVVDVRMLLKGHRIVTVKSEETWQLSLAGLMKLEKHGTVNDGENSSKGMSYRDYLRILLFLEKKEKVGMRALDLIEQNLRSQYGFDFFKADYCISKIQIESTCNLRRGIAYRFPTYYGYH